MDFKALERLWASNENNLSKAAEAYLMEDMMNTLRNRRRKFRLWMVFVGLKLSAFTALIAYIVFAGRDIVLGKEWAIVFMLLIPWIGFVVFKLQFHRHLKAFPGTDMPMQQNLRALLDENLTTQKRARTMAIMHAVFAVFAGIALWQLTATAKMTTDNALQAGTVFGGALLLSTIVQGVMYFRSTVPEGERLKRLLQDYDA